MHLRHVCFTVFTIYVPTKYIVNRTVSCIFTTFCHFYQTHPLENDTPAVLTTESVHVTIDNRSTSASPKTISPNNSAISGSSSLSSALNNNNNNYNGPKQRPVNVTQPNLNLNKTSQPAVIELPSNNVIMSGTPGNTLRTIELSSGRIREGFGKSGHFISPRKEISLLQRSFL